MSQIYLHDIQSVVLSHLQKANRSIEAAVAWFTDQAIFDLLLKRLHDGIQVTLVLHDDEINHNTAFDWGEFGRLGGMAYYFGDASETMHHKFCVIDGETLLLGSYNWTYRAAHRNRENLIVLTTADGLDTDSFRDELQVLVRLARPVTELVTIPAEPPTSNLIRNPVPDLLRARIRTLEIEIAVLEEQKRRDESLIDQYHFLIRVHIGDLLIAIADLKAKLAERLARQTRRRSDTDRADNLRSTYERTHQQVSVATDNPLPSLTENAEIELRRLYRQAATQAHPDRFMNDPVRYALANKYMASLNEAYKQKDLAQLRRLVEDLEDGLIFNTHTDTDDKAVLEKRLARLLALKTDLMAQIQALQQDEGYQWMTNDAENEQKLVILREQLLAQKLALEKQL